MQKGPSAFMSVAFLPPANQTALNADDNKSPTIPPQQELSKQNNDASLAAGKTWSGAPRFKLGPTNFKAGRTAPFPVDTELDVFCQKPFVEKYLLFHRGSPQLYGMCSVLFLSLLSLISLLLFRYIIDVTI
jgi:hypothetical protein